MGLGLLKSNRMKGEVPAIEARLRTVSGFDQLATAVLAPVASSADMLKSPRGTFCSAKAICPRHSMC